MQGFALWLGRYRWLWIVTGVAFVAAVVSIIWVDEPVAHDMHDREMGRHAFIQLVTELGKAYWWLVPAALVAGWFSWRRRWDLANRAAFVFAAVGGSGILVNLLKIVFGRQRPKLLFADGEYGFTFFNFGYDYASFPSGHSTVAGSLAASLWVFLPRWVRGPVVLVTLFIALSRVLVTAHYISDVLAGYLLGIWFAFLLYRVFTTQGWLDAQKGPILPKRWTGREVQQSSTKSSQADAS